VAELILAVLLGVWTVVAFSTGRRQACALAAAAGPNLHSRPNHHGWFTALWAGAPALLLLLLWTVSDDRVIEYLVLSAAPDDVRALSPEALDVFLNDVRALATGNIASRAADPVLSAASARYASLSFGSGLLAALVCGGLALAGWVHARRRIEVALPARVLVERVVRGSMALCSVLAILITVGIVLSLFFEALRFFALISPLEFFFGVRWSPQLALRADQVGSSGAFGAIPVFVGTMVITAIAVAVAGPAGLMSAVYLSEYASSTTRAWVKPTLEILAGIPTVVYGFFAALTVAPWVRAAGELVGLDVASESALAAGLIMGVMIIPFVSSLSDDVINAVPQTLRDGAYALGATRSETIRQVILPAALPGIVGALLLATSRAIGETMIVVMAAGLAANLTVNPLEAVTTVTVQIVSLLVGDQEFDSAKTLAAFALGLVLFAVTLSLNVVALRTVRRYREKYD
jgi:phosphate transport system permease protein